MTNYSDSIAKINSLVTKINEGSTALGSKTGKDYPQLTTLSNEPVVSNQEVVSSNSVLDTKQTEDAVTQAGSALVTDGGQNQVSPYMESLYNTQNVQNKSYEDQLNSLELMFDSSLARSNQKYGQLQQELQQNFQKATQIADVNAAALNPYSQAQGAATADNFKNKITENYQRQAQNLQAQAEAAEGELRAGNYQAFVAISNNMKNSNAQFQQNMQKFLLDQQSAVNAQKNADRSYNLQRDEFGFRMQESATDDFMDFVNDFGMDENLRGEINNYFTSGEITDGLMPLIEKGIRAGLSPDEALSIAQYDTLDQTKTRQRDKEFAAQQSLGWYNAKTGRMNATKGGTSGVSENGWINSSPIVSVALQHALSGKGMTDSQRGYVTELFDSQGLEGAMSWAAQNKLGEAQKTIFNQYASGAQILMNVSGQLDNAEYGAGPYKTLGEKVKPWLSIQRDPEYAQLRQNIEFAQAQTRKGFYGTAVTLTEKVNADKFLINDTDSLEIIKIKVANLGGILQFANDYNAASSLGIQDHINPENYIRPIGETGEQGSGDPQLDALRSQYGY